MRSCMFCGSRVNSVEHLFAQWMTKDLNLPETPTANLRVEPGPAMSRLNSPDMVRDYELTDRVIPASAARKTVKRTCQRCNNGWMSDIDKAMKPMANLLHGVSMDLTPWHQDRIARWAYKTSLMVSWDTPNLRVEQPEQIADFYRTRRVPGHVQIGLGSHTDPRLRFVYNVLSVGPEGSDVAPTVSMTMLVVGCLVVSVHDFPFVPGVGNPMSSQEWAEMRMDLVFPTQPTTIEWPAHEPHDDDSVGHLSRTYLGLD